MKQPSQTGLWLFGAVVVAVLVAALAYFLVISPELDTASEANADAEIARADNELLELQIIAAQTKEKQVPEWQDEIGKISLDMPATVEQPPIEELIASTLAKYDLPMVETTYGRPEEVIPTLTEGYSPPTLSTDEEGEEGADPSASPEPSASPSPAAEPSAEPSMDADGNPLPEKEDEKPEDAGPAFAGLVAIPVTIATEGSAADVLSFMKDMQTQIDRFYTATNFTIAKATPTEELPGRPALTEDEWTVSLSGMVFALIDPAYSFPGDNPGTVEPFEPGASVPNPFSPLPGTEEAAAG